MKMKSESKHTPVKWFLAPFRKDSQTGFAGSTIYGPDHLRIAEVKFTPIGSSPTKGRSEAEHKANVALITSAPELLAACEAALSCPDIYGTVLARILTDAVRAAGGNCNPLGTDRKPTEPLADYEARVEARVAGEWATP
jgi:hypothetical protein